MNYRILLVEDSREAALLVNLALGTSKSGEFEVVAVSSLGAASEALARQSFDAILLDLNLPDSQGLGTFTEIRERAAGHTPVVILTAVEDEDIATTAIGRGAADFLIKGEVLSANLARRIRFAVERCRATSAQHSAGPGRIVVVVGAKGGVGVSTTAINLAAVFSQRGANVGLVELRPNTGALSVILNTAAVLTLDTLADFGGSHVIDRSSGKLPFGPRLLPRPPL